MRIPPSLIVMSLLTATPFGLAIRDTLNHKQSQLGEDSPWGALDSRSERHDRETYERYEQDMAREAAEKAEKRAEAVGRFSQLFGTKPATLGALFDGIRLGADSESFQPEDARARIEKESENGFISVSFDTDASALRGINVAISSADYDTAADEEMCRSLHDKLVAAWGPATNSTWLDETKHQTAFLDMKNNCSLEFQRALPAAEWLAAVPLGLVGKSEQALDDYAAKSAVSFDDRDDDTAHWFITSLGTSGTLSQVTAMIEKHKIVGLRVMGSGDFDSVIAVRDGLTKQLKTQPKRDPEDDTIMTWKHKPAVRMTWTDNESTFDLLVGKDPSE